MCVILKREAGVTIPADKIETACDINKHGFGVVWRHGSKLQYEYCLDQPNDPKVVSDLLQKLKDKQVFVHLRHATVGTVSQENAHPFIVLNKKKNGLDLAFMHNGTLFEYKPKDDAVKSDTSNFNDTFVKPLALRIHKYAGDNLIGDDIFIKVLSKEIGYTSVVVLVDSRGRHLIFNEKHGAQFEGWWASNDYSFKQTHTRSSWKPGRTVWSDWEVGDSLEDTPFSTPVTDNNNTEVLPWEHWGAGRGKPVSIPDKTRVNYEHEQVAKLVNEAKFRHGESIMNAQSQVLKELRVLRTPFIETARLTSLDDLHRLTEADLIRISSEYPNAVGRLVLDLLVERVALTEKNKSQAARIIELTSKPV